MAEEVWDSVDRQAEARTVSRALIIESAVKEYIAKLDRIDATMKKEEQ